MRMSHYKIIRPLQRILFLSILLSPVFTHGQATVNNTVNALDGVQNVLLGEGVTASNITFLGNNAQIGSFTCTGGCTMGISSGLVMGSGNIDQVPGNATGSSNAAPASGTSVTDADLLSLTGTSIRDAAVLEFDFIPTGDTILFKFVFGSEEYPEFINAGFNDAFGFFLSGPGISGPYTNNAKNIALLPNGITPVTIDNVNPFSNSAFYVTNTSGSNTIECDGYTTVLTAFSVVQCGQSYHLKLAICDAFDALYDSFVFLEAGSFQSNQLALQFTAPNLAPAGGGVYEGCDTAYLTFTRPAGQSAAAVYGLQYTGTAINGVDFETLPTQLEFAAGQLTTSLPITAIPDGNQEGTESFTITVTGTGCSASTTSIDIGISDLPELQVTIPDVIINCGQQALMTPQISGGLGNYLVFWEAANLYSPTLSTFPTSPTGYNFVVTDTCGVTPFNGIANVDFIQNPPITVDVGQDIVTTCLENVSITSVASGGFGDYEYSWSIDGETFSVNPDITFNGFEDVEIVLTVTDACGEEGTDQVMVTYPPVPILLDLGPDNSVTCIDETVLTPTISGGIGTYSYQWYTQTTQLGIAPQISFTTSENATVVLDVVDQCGNLGSDEVVFDVPFISVLTDLGDDLVVTCIDVNNVQGNINGGVGQFNYVWLLNGTQVGTGPSYNVQVAEDAVLQFTATDECGNSASDQINISVPPVDLSVDLGEDIVTGCATPNTVNPIVTGGVGQFTYSWTDATGILSDGSTLTYQTIESSTVSLQLTDQCGNFSSDQITFEVPDEPIEITLTQDSTICKGYSIELTGSATGGAGMLSYMWAETEETTASITVSPENSSFYTFMAADACGNYAEETVFVSVYDINPLFSAEYIDDNGLQLTNYTSPNLIYEWEFNDGTSTPEYSPTHYFNNNDEWIVTLTVSGLTGCTKSVTQTYYPFGNIFIPTAFTPDNDGINDFFFAKGHDLRHFEMWIYNRAGEEIFYSNDINTPWDGSFKGREHYVPNGIYNYRMLAIGKRENVIEKAGHICLIR